MTTTAADIPRFFQEYVRGFLIGDIERCILARANFGVATMLSTATEVLGGLDTGNLGVTRQSRKNFNAGLKLMEWSGDRKYYVDLNLKVKLDAADAELYDIFRCGFVHEYIPKENTMVHNNASAVGHYTPADQGVGWHTHLGTDYLRLHTNAYLRDLKQAFAEMEVRVMAAGADQTAFLKSVNRVESQKVTKR